MKAAAANEDYELAKILKNKISSLENEKDKAAQERKAQQEKLDALSIKLVKLDGDKFYDRETGDIYV